MKHNGVGIGFLCNGLLVELSNQCSRNNCIVTAVAFLLFRNLKLTLVLESNTMLLHDAGCTSFSF